MNRAEIKYSDGDIDRWHNQPDNDRKFLSYPVFVLGTMEMENEDNEPVMCSKCNKTFQNESEYLQHYNEKHKPEKI